MSFASVESKISKKEGIPMKNAGAVLAKSSRDASPEAKAKNPNLKKVKMPMAKKGMAGRMAENMNQVGGGY